METEREQDGRFAVRFASFIRGACFRRFHISSLHVQLLREQGSDVSELAQAYIHLKPYEASDRKIRSLGKYAKRAAIQAASDIYGGDVSIEVEMEEGSLVTRVTVIGSIALGVYGFVANYKGFKEGLVEMCDDAREFSFDVCRPFVKKAGVSNEEIYRFERRLKTPGKLYRVTKRIEKLERSVEDLSPKIVKKELGELRAELDAIFSEATPEDRRLIESRLKPKNLPPPSDWPIIEPRRLALARDDETELPLLLTTATTRVEVLKRRLVFKETARVPSKRSLPLKKVRSDKQKLLLPPTTTN